jgi:hypothetical protein
MGTGSDSDSDSDCSEVPATQLPPPNTMPTLRASAEPSSAAQANVTSTSSDSEEDEQSQELLTPVPQSVLSINHALASEHIEQPSQQLDDAIEVEGADAPDASDDDCVSKFLTYGDNNETVSSYQSFTFFSQLILNICNVMIDHIGPHQH